MTDLVGQISQYYIRIVNAEKTTSVHGGIRPENIKLGSAEVSVHESPAGCRLHASVSSHVPDTSTQSEKEAIQRQYIHVEHLCSSAMVLYSAVSQQ
jgi:hypothetical protein